MLLPMDQPTGPSQEWQDGVWASIRQLQRNKMTARVLYNADYVAGIDACIAALEGVLARGGTPSLTPVD
jgi:hypothetical protein